MTHAHPHTVTCSHTTTQSHARTPLPFSPPFAVRRCKGYLRTHSSKFLLLLISPLGELAKPLLCFLQPFVIVIQKPSSFGRIITVCKEQVRSLCSLVSACTFVPPGTTPSQHQQKKHLNTNLYNTSTTQHQHNTSQHCNTTRQETDIAVFSVRASEK